MRRARFFPSSSAESGARQPRRVGRSRLPLHRRLLAARSAAPYWIAVGLLALATGGFVTRLVGRATAAERRWGATQSVIVAVRALPAGRSIPLDATRREDRPAAFVPDGALRRLPPANPLIAPVARGAVLTASDLASHTSDRLSGQVAMALPVGEASLALHAGQRVDVFVTFDPSLAPPGAPATSRVATRALVLRADKAVVTVVVEPSEAPDLATALAQGTVTLALVD